MTIHRVEHLLSQPIIALLLALRTSAWLVNLQVLSSAICLPGVVFVDVTGITSQEQFPEYGLGAYHRNVTIVDPDHVYDSICWPIYID
jgi:hypothetical protein